MCTNQPTSLIVGNGLIGSALARQLQHHGHRVHTVSRRAASGDTGEHTSLDLSTTTGRSQLAHVIDQVNAQTVVLVHGPSDVTWTQEHEEEATRIHVEVAATAARHARRVIFVSTDNVFDGTQGMRTPTDATAPQNAYGRAKLAAEQQLSAASTPTLIARVSLVYGWTPPGYRATYAQRVLEQASAGRESIVPVDQTFTPIHIDDVSQTLAAACSCPWDSKVLHLAGPTELSRHEFALLGYLAAGADQRMVQACNRAGSEWASRPEYSSLACDDLTWLQVPQPRPACAGLDAMLANRPVPV